jgi:hypothetical protein
MITPKEVMRWHGLHRNSFKENARSREEQFRGSQFENAAGSAAGGRYTDSVGNDRGTASYQADSN